MTTRRQLLEAGAATVAAGAVSLLPASSAWANYTTRVNPYRRYGTWEGWGASLAFWANVFGRNDTLADLFFTRRWVSVLGRTLPGLGLNVVRYELGSCMFQPAWPGGPRMVHSPSMPAYRKIEGFWVNWRNANPNSDSWNWDNDAEQRAMLLKAKARGANVMQMFSLSPIWWMCKNHNPCGARDGGENLQSWNHEQHARYLAIVAKRAREHWGIRFRSVEPFNEPTADWWVATGHTEGCHMSRPTQQRIVRLLRRQLDVRGLSDVAVAASDESYYQQAVTTWEHMVEHGADHYIGQVNTHGYMKNDDGGWRTGLYRRVHARGKRLWQSEYGDRAEHGLYLANQISLDMRYLHPTAWCYWQPVAGSVIDQDTGRNHSWGLLKATYSADTRRKGGRLGVTTPYPGTGRLVTNRYFVFAQYARHIRPGMLIIDSGDQATVAAYDPDQHRLVLVTVRGRTSERVTYDLSRFRTVGRTARRWVTDASPRYRIARQYQRISDARLDGKRLSLLFGAYSIQTIEIDGVRL
ncbi:glycoside hydrolase [Streptomyces sp. JB150]|uniref:glycoside hydrolase n=1 Tax=Streptomyces sp. JB150 TaxID=2714844 RepID=UPI00140E4294|nr:glycoside hydrolase [Streptomyces sp. JB150]QIJ65423.1 beta-1,6-galactanase [Streptomyces sp. JB150]